MGKKIKVSKPLVLLHGDEMAQVAFEQIIERFIKKHLDINLIEIDLSAENRVVTNGLVVKDAIRELKKHKVGIKNAGITVNSKQLDALLESNPKINKDRLDPLATKSPNGAIRKGIAGNITREDIPFTNIKKNVADWIGRDIEVVTMMEGGQLDSYNQVIKKSGELSVQFIDRRGDKIDLHSRRIRRDGIFLLATNDIAHVKSWARDFFQMALDKKKPAYIGLKDTVIPGYDGVMRKAVDGVFKKEFADKFKKKKLTYTYGLIDAQAAQMIVNPPKKALWGIPDNNTGRKMLKLVEALKEFGMPDRGQTVSISRMSAGGGDQYGSFNMEIPANGTLVIKLNSRIVHQRPVRKGDPILLMSNEKSDIRSWVEQSFKEAEVKNQEIYFGLKREYMPYDDQFSNVIREVRDKLSEGGKTPPPFMVMTPSKQVRKMIVDPPRNARYASLNLDGDIFSDITAAMGGSLATASSIISSKDGTYLFEAPHGTAPDLYEKYIKSGGKEVIFNPSALLWAFANALEIIAQRSRNKKLKDYLDRLKRALIKTVSDCIITGDIKGKTRTPEKEKVVDLIHFLKEVEKRLGY